jgi:hypothetical protein
LFSGE